MVVYSTDGTDYSGQVYSSGSFTIKSLLEGALRIDIEGYLSSDANKNIRHLTYDNISGGGGSPLTFTFSKVNDFYGTTANTFTICAADTSLNISDIVTEL